MISWRRASLFRVIRDAAFQLCLLFALAVRRLFEELFATTRPIAPCSRRGAHRCCRLNLLVDDIVRAEPMKYFGRSLWRRQLLVIRIELFQNVDDVGLKELEVGRRIADHVPFAARRHNFRIVVVEMRVPESIDAVAEHVTLRETVDKELAIGFVLAKMGELAIEQRNLREARSISILKVVSAFGAGRNAASFCQYLLYIRIYIQNQQQK